MHPLGKGAYLKALLVAWLALAPRASAADFESLAAGTVFGLGTDAPGSIVHVDEVGVRMTVENFRLGATDYFFFAEVGGPGSQEFTTQSLSLDSISVRFDFADVGFSVDGVTFEFADLGGPSNFAVNDETLFVIDPFASLPINVATGVTATIDAGLVTLQGPIQSLLIGGQELVIDNVIPVPEPATGVLMALALLTLWRRQRTA